MMTAQEFARSLSALNLTIADAAQLLDVSERSVRRWSESEAVPGPVEAAIRAWMRLNERFLPWKPDSISIFDDDREQIRKMRDHSAELDVLMREVEARGGPHNPWSVDLARQRATFGPAEVGFYRLQSGSFSPSTYRRLDRTPLDADRLDIQDACYCIAQELGRARAINRALLEIASYTEKHAGTYARDGAARPTKVEMDRRTNAIVGLADELNQLASAGLDGGAQYAEFETILNKLHRLGLFPNINLVSAVARTMTRPAERSEVLVNSDNKKRGRKK
jgi:hypothetical protein